MPITINKTNNTTSGFCHEYTVAIKRDGSVKPSTLSFGNYGDKNITKVTFDLSDLSYQGQFSLKNYTHALIIQFPRIVDEDEGLDYKVYALDYDDNSTSSVFEIPEELTTGDLSYQLIYALLEENDSGNVVNQQEVFISKTFSAFVTKTSWSDKIDLDESISFEDTEVALVKPKIILSPSASHQSISASASVLGEKRDSLIKRIVLNENNNSKLDEGLNNRFLIINNKVIKMLFDSTKKNICSCFIPPEITSKAGTYSYFIIAQSENGDKRWVSNALTLTVNNNFLNGEKDFIITSQGCLLTSDNVFVISSDNWAVDTQ